MGNCQALTTWPEEIMKILHCVFNALAVVFLILAHTHAKPDLTTAIVNKDLYFEVTTGYYLAYNYLFVMMVILLVAAAGLLIWFIFADPRKFKMGLLIYYLVAIALSATSSIVLINHFGGEQCKGDGNYCMKDRGAWLLAALVGSVGSWATYTVSACFNAGGKP